MLTVQAGSRGPDVKTLQEKLNTRLTPSPRLVPDGVFGGVTHATVIRFQRENWLVEDGQVGPATWNALLGTETYAPILHAIPFIPQPTNTTCWAASTAMVTRSSVPTVIARTPPDLIASDGGLKNFSNTLDPVTNSARFAASHSMIVLPPMSWLPSGLVGLLARGPLIFDILWDMQGYTSGRGSPGHMIAIVGIRGDDDPSGRGTTLRVYDPWAPNIGKKYSKGYLKWINEVPTITYHIYHKA